MISVTFAPQTEHERALLNDFIDIYNKAGRGAVNVEPAQAANDSPTLEQLRAKLMSLPREKALELLKQFGVPKLPSLPVEKYESFWAAMEAAA